jgi:hypothetical protein
MNICKCETAVGWVTFCGHDRKWGRLNGCHSGSWCVLPPSGKLSEWILYRKRVGNLQKDFSLLQKEEDAPVFEEEESLCVVNANATLLCIEWLKALVI